MKYIMTNFALKLCQKKVTNSFLCVMRVTEYVFSVLMLKMMMMLIKKNIRVYDKKAQEIF